MSDIVKRLRGKQSALEKLIADLAWRGPTGKTMGHIVLTRQQAIVAADEIARLSALEGLMARCLKSVESGKWRDKAGLSAEAHPVWDDVREALKK